jgi:hypothetical protein
MTIEFPNTGSFSFSALTFEDLVNTLPPSQALNVALVYFGVTNLPLGTTVTVSNIALSGDGITNTLSFSSVQLTEPYDDNEFNATPTNLVSLNTPVTSYNPIRNIVSFDIQINGGPLPGGATLFYAVNYRRGITQSFSGYGTINLIAASSQNTFGLPADVVALITSRFGSVANFLRLRNQGYI